MSTLTANTAASSSQTIPLSTNLRLAKNDPEPGPTDPNPTEPPRPPVLTTAVLAGLFAKIDTSFRIEQLGDLFRVSGGDEASATLSLFNTLRRLVLGDTAALPTEGEGVEAARRAALDKLNIALDTGAYRGRVVSLVGLTGAQVFTLAAGHAGVRYSLNTFTPFAILNPQTDLYARFNQDGSLTRFDPSTGARLLSDEWLSDRSQLFVTQLQAAGAGTVGITGNQSFVIEDRTQRNADGSNMRITLTADAANRPIGRVTFGTNNSEGEILAGGTGNDRLYGGGGDDNIRGGAGDDYIEGGAGNDQVLGGTGNDLLIGDAGDDEIEGGIGDDVVRAGAGDDVLTGGRGNDRLDGGEGFDTYIFESGDGNDVIIDSDGRGELIYQGNALRGVATATNGSYVSADGKITYSFAGDIEEGGVLTITTENGRIKIRDFRNGMLGITLGDGSPAALFPPAPTVDPVLEPNDVRRGGINTGDRLSDSPDPYKSASVRVQRKLSEQDLGVVAAAAGGEVATDPAVALLANDGPAVQFVSGEAFWQSAKAASLGEPSALQAGAAPTDAYDSAAIISTVGVTSADVAQALAAFHDANIDGLLGGDAAGAHTVPHSSNALLHGTADGTSGAIGVGGQEAARLNSNPLSNTLGPRIGG